VNSRFAFGDREAGALRADLDFVGLTKPRSAMRFDGILWPSTSSTPFLGASFEGGRHAARVAMIRALEG
jgi:hypothetical protein